ncbi:MAG: tetratricopeptide repeat protein [Gemmataceae bacterium]|nr:tetratricopeptide repeat protein [Gemmataceae bacterium]
MMPDKVERLCQRAQQAIAERDWEKAKQTYLMALGLRGDLADVHYGLATVYFQLRELTSAAHHFREVTRLDPIRAPAYVNLGAVLNLMGQYDDAVAALRRGIQLDGQRVEAYYNLGLVYKRKGQPDLAVTSYKEALRLNPRMADAHLNLANLYMERMQPRLAIVHYEEALKVRQAWDKALDGLERAKEAAAAGPDLRGSSAIHPVADLASFKPGPVGSDLDRQADPAQHGAFLAHLHQATAIVEEQGKLLAKVVAEEIEPAIKELSTALLNSRGSRAELEGCLGRFENALGRMKATHQAMKAQAAKVGEIGENFPQ